MKQSIAAIVEAYAHHTEPVVVELIELLNDLKPETSEPSFEVAEQIVIARIVTEQKRLSKEFGKDSYLSLSFGGWKEPSWNVYPESVTNDNVSAATLVETLALVKPKPSPEQERLAKIAKLRAELAELEKESAAKPTA